MLSQISLSRAELLVHNKTVKNMSVGHGVQYIDILTMLLRKAQDKHGSKNLLVLLHITKLEHP